MTPPAPVPRDTRLALALDAGLALPDDGLIVILNPGAGERFDTLPSGRLFLVSPHIFVLNALGRRGLSAGAAPPGPAAAVVVCLPRSRAEARDAIARAAAVTHGPVILDGQKADGIDSILRTLRPHAAVSEPIAKAHGKIAWFPSPGASALADWRAAPGHVTDSTGRVFRTMAGIFSADGVDPGSALLAAALPAGLKGTGADLGAGWGYLAASLLTRPNAIDALHLIEADARALDCARANVTDPRARFHWHDATLPLPGLALDFVVMNPPFHIGRAGDPSLGAAFIAAAAACLKPGGRLWLVANRHLPYEAALAGGFKTFEEIAGGSNGYKLLLAQGPRAGSTTRHGKSRASTSKRNRL